MKRTILMGTGALLLTSSVAFAGATDGVVYDNGAWDGSLAGASSQLDSAYPFDSQTADDFVLASDFTLTGASWSGVYFNGSAPLQSEDFNVLIYADDGSGTAPTGGPLDPSGTAIASFTVSPTRVDTGDGVNFDYSADFGGGVALTAGTQYWVAIQSIMLFPPQFGWNATGSVNGATSVQGFPLLGLDYWTDTGLDRAFQLHGTDVPAPGALALLGLAGVAARRRRRA